MKLVIFLGLFITNSIIGCSSINKFLYSDKCKSNNWKVIGAHDGKSGRLNSLKSWEKRCAPYNITPDAVSYQAGVKIGQIQYCKDQGAKLGIEGKISVIPAKCNNSVTKSNFLEGYNSGQTKFCNYETSHSLGKQGKDALNLFPFT